MINITTVFKGINSDENIKKFVNDKFERLGKFLADEADIKVTLWEYDSKKVCDAMILSKGHEFFAKSHSDDFQKSINMLKDKLKTQILKETNENKHKFHTRKKTDDQEGI